MKTEFKALKISNKGRGSCDFTLAANFFWNFEVLNQFAFGYV